MRIRTYAALALCLAVGTAGCASRGGRSNGWTESRSGQVVTVRNDNWLDVAIYLVKGVSRFRLGTVRGASSETFRIQDEPNAATPVRLLADPIGSQQRYLTEPIVVSPGQRIELRVGSPIAVSTVAIWDR